MQNLKTENPIKEEIAFADFLKLDIRAGTILDVVENKKAKIAAYVLTIDFGSDIGIKTSSAQITRNYQARDLVGKQICAVVNFAPKKVAGIKSEVLVLAIVCKDNGTVLVEPNQKVSNGEPLL